MLYNMIFFFKCHYDLLKTIPGIRRYIVQEGLREEGEDDSEYQESIVGKCY